VGVEEREQHQDRDDDNVVDCRRNAAATNRRCAFSNAVASAVKP